MAKSKDIRYWEINSSPVGVQVWHIQTPLDRMIAVPNDGFLVEVFDNTEHLTQAIRYAHITSIGTAHLPRELLAETHFAFGRHNRAVKLLQDDFFTCEKVSQIHTSYLSSPYLIAFVDVAKSMMASRAAMAALWEIHNV